jgi:hypothetical protein
MHPHPKPSPFEGEGITLSPSRGRVREGVKPITKRPYRNALAVDWTHVVE